MEFSNFVLMGIYVSGSRYSNIYKIFVKIFNFSGNSKKRNNSVETFLNNN